MSEVITIKIPRIASEVERGDGGKWFLDAEGNIIGGVSALVSYPPT